MNLAPVAGIDVGKKFSEMAILSPINEIFSRIRINHDSYSNFEKAFKLPAKAEKDFAAKPVIVMESTGHYNKILFRSMTKIGYEVCVINPIKNIGVRKVKNDKVDARKPALLYRFEQLKITIIPHEGIGCLKSLCRYYFKLSDHLTAYKNKLTSIVGQIFLSITDVFKDINSAAALAILEKYPTSEDILKTDKKPLGEVRNGLWKNTSQLKQIT